MKTTLPLIFLLAVSASAQEKTSVRTALPAAATVAGAYELPGRTEPIESATIFTRATDIVRERKFDIGDRVKAGDVLIGVAASGAHSERFYRCTANGFRLGLTWEQTAPYGGTGRYRWIATDVILKTGGEM